MPALTSGRHGGGPWPRQQADCILECIRTAGRLGMLAAPPQPPSVGIYRVSILLVTSCRKDGSQPRRFEASRPETVQRRPTVNGSFGRADLGRLLDLATAGARGRIHEDQGQKRAHAGGLDVAPGLSCADPLSKRYPSLRLALPGWCSPGLGGRGGPLKAFPGTPSQAGTE